MVSVPRRADLRPVAGGPARQIQAALESLSAGDSGRQADQAVELGSQQSQRLPSAGGIGLVYVAAVQERVQLGGQLTSGLVAPLLVRGGGFHAAWCRPSRPHLG